jgi:tetratricopeptide (TPR) repeat protein
MKLGVAAAGLVLLGLSLPAFAQDKPDALELYRVGDYGQAVTVCLQELQETPKNVDSYVVLSWSYLKLKENQEAFAAAQKGLAIAPNDARLIQVLGEADVFLGGKMVEALGFLQEYVALRPNGDRIARVYWLMGECYLSLKEYQNADIAISTALYWEQSNAPWWARLGYARELANDFTGSQEAYSRALQLDPNNTDAIQGKARVDKKLQG